MNPICRFILILSGRAPSTPTPPPDPGADDFLLLETGDFLLLETGDKLILE
jgi:hypothetical protein